MIFIILSIVIEIVSNLSMLDLWFRSFMYDITGIGRYCDLAVSPTRAHLLWGQFWFWGRPVWFFLVRTFYLRLWPCVSLLPTGSGSRSRPSKETREVIDMGKMSAASLTSEAANAGGGCGGRDHNNSSSSRKGSFPLNGILKKMENKQADQDNTSSSNKKSNTKKEAAGKQNS